MRPHRRDPERHYYDNFMYLSHGAAARIGATKPEERRFFKYGTDLMNREIADQDLAVSTGQQLGLSSRGYSGVRLAEMIRLARIILWHLPIAIDINCR